MAERVGLRLTDPANRGERMGLGLTGPFVRVWDSGSLAADEYAGLGLRDRGTQAHPRAVCRRTSGTQAHRQTVDSISSPAKSVL